MPVPLREFRTHLASGKQPGVYLIMDPKAVVVYVGKTGNLYNRIGTHASGDINSSSVAQHLYDGYTYHADYKLMSAAVREMLTDYSVAWIVARSEALDQLEADLIQQYQPAYNR